MSKIIVAGRHRNAALAERALARHVKQHKAIGGQIVSRRNDRGLFSNSGRNFTFVLETKPKRKKKKKEPTGKLFRITVAITYPKGSGKKRGYFGYYVKNWSGSSKQIPPEREERLTELATAGLEKHLNYPRDRFWFDLETNTSVEQPTRSGEDPKLKGTWELFSDQPSQVTGQFKSLSAAEKFVEEYEQ